MDTVLGESERRELRRKARSATLAALHALGGESRREAIRERAVALGDFDERELSATAAERSGAKQTRLLDQQLSWALSDLKREGLVDNPERGTWKLSPAGERLHELGRMPYPEYLNTPEWEQTRTAALEHAEYCCAIDLRHTEELDVLHRTRARLGSELPGDLVVLCGPCLELHREPEEQPPPPPRVGSIPPPGPHLVPEPAPLDPADDAAAERRPRLLRRLLAS